MTISFLHHGDATWASYRYRAQWPAAYLGASLNDPTADVLVFAKPMPEDVATAQRAKTDGRVVVVDYCDAHWARLDYVILARVADLVTCPTTRMASHIQRHLDPAGRVHVIPEPYGYDERLPHCAGHALFWFGHVSNLESLRRVIPTLPYPVTVMANEPTAIPWSFQGLQRELGKADIVVMPATKPYKSANRTVEAIRQGCFVVAEPHPALEGFPIWIGDLAEGIHWAADHPAEANARIAQAQAWIRERFSMETIGDQWRAVLQPVLV